MKALEEQEKREDYLEAIGDVTKQGNLDGFYRHLYDQKINYDDKVKKEKLEEDVKQEPKSEEDASGDEQKTRKRRSMSKDSGKVSIFCFVSILLCFN